MKTLFFIAAMLIGLSASTQIDTSRRADFQEPDIYGEWNIYFIETDALELSKLFEQENQ